MFDIQKYQRITKNIRSTLRSNKETIIGYEGIFVACLIEMLHRKIFLEAIQGLGSLSIELSHLANQTNQEMLPQFMRFEHSYSDVNISDRKFIAKIICQIMTDIGFDAFFIIKSETLIYLDITWSENDK